jgi:hypothetical protein
MCGIALELLGRPPRRRADAAHRIGLARQRVPGPEADQGVDGVLEVMPIDVAQDRAQLVIGALRLRALAGLRWQEAVVVVIAAVIAIISIDLTVALIVPGDGGAGLRDRAVVVGSSLTRNRPRRKWQHT